VGVVVQKWAKPGPGTLGDVATAALASVPGVGSAHEWVILDRFRA
jgi:hypothetical protein